MQITQFIIDLFIVFFASTSLFTFRFRHNHYQLPGLLPPSWTGGAVASPSVGMGGTTGALCDAVEHVPGLCDLGGTAGIGEAESVDGEGEERPSGSCSSGCAGNTSMIAGRSQLTSR